MLNTESTFVEEFIVNQKRDQNDKNSSYCQIGKI